MNERRIGLGLFLAVLFVLAAYGVATTPQPRTVAQVGSADAFVCPLPRNAIGSADGPTLVDETVRPPRPISGTVPDTFTPTSAVVCDVDIGNTVAADGTASFFERHYSGDFAPVIEALNAPSVRRALLPASCDTSNYSMMPLIDMWLLDDDGRAVAPSYPLGDCAFDNTLGLYEIQSMTETAAIEHHARLDADGIALLFGCPSTMTALPVSGLRSLLDLPVSFSAVCSFDTTGDTPVFTGAHTMGGTEPVLNLDTLAALPPAGPCTEPATSVVAEYITDPLSEQWTQITVVIELNGCQRILADNTAPRTATPDIVAALSNTS